MRWVAVALIVAGAVAAGALPGSGPSAPNQSPDPVVPPVAVCPVEEGSGRATDLSVVSSVDDEVEVRLFGAGASPDPIGTVTGPTGGVTVSSADLAAVGRLGALVEMPGRGFAAGFISAGPETFSGEPCFHRPPPGQTLITGASTAEGHEFEMQLLNPYSGEAVVDLVVQTETGREANERFDSLVVPARGSTEVAFTRLIPGRSTISVTVEATAGSAVAIGSQRRGGDTASWRAVEAGADWYLPIPAGLPGTRVVLATPMNADVDYQLDLYSPDGRFEAWRSGTLGARGQAAVDLSELAGAATALRVVASGPVVPTLWAGSAETGLVATTASQLQARTWLLPGAAAPPGGAGSLVLVNTGVEPSVATVRMVRAGALQQEIDLGVDAVAEVPLASARGYRVDSDGSVVALWVARRGGSAMAALGVPLDGG